MGHPQAWRTAQGGGVTRGPLSGLGEGQSGVCVWGCLETKEGFKFDGGRTSWCLEEGAMMEVASWCRRWAGRGEAGKPREAAATDRCEVPSPGRQRPRPQVHLIGH